MSEIFDQHAESDGFLYITYSGESTFGTYWLVNWLYIEEIVVFSSNVFIMLKCKIFDVNDLLMSE